MRRLAKRWKVGRFENPLKPGRPAKSWIIRLRHVGLAAASAQDDALVRANIGNNPILVDLILIGFSVWRGHNVFGARAWPSRVFFSSVNDFVTDAISIGHFAIPAIRKRRKYACPISRRLV